MTFLDTTIFAGVTYDYRVFASNIAGSSAYATATFTVPAAPAAPSAFAATNSLGTGNNRTVVLTWTDNSTDETGFTVQRCNQRRVHGRAQRRPPSPSTPPDADP